jgi:hypothetical protein
VRKLNYVYLLAALLICQSLLSGAARSAEGALQYPPPSIGADAQPPPPARMVPQTVSPRRIELGISGSSLPPSTPRFLIHPPYGLDRPETQPQSGSGG